MYMCPAFCTAQTPLTHNYWSTPLFIDLHRPSSSINLSPRLSIYPFGFLGIYLSVSKAIHRVICKKLLKRPWCYSNTSIYYFKQKVYANFLNIVINVQHPTKFDIKS